ncbi:hypothetical protein HK103_005329 [Boothiomyces macroporosus]|uniref:Guanylate cyclase n=1 Tax=Boothiomyces macroporosus TaxID=261099 RepID=A0AAD5ULJ0_9FUNG|nr:hypothetical protein HK103_005329 [Boothiomyces macroporosus]
MSSKGSAMRKTTDKPKKKMAVTNSGLDTEATSKSQEQRNSGNRPSSSRTNEIPMTSESDISKEDNPIYDSPKQEHQESSNRNPIENDKEANEYQKLREQTELVEENVAIGEAEVLRSKEIAFMMRQNEMAMSNLVTAHNIDLQKMKQLYERTLAARRERKINKRETRKTIRGAKKRDLIIQQQEKSALAAARVKETIAEKRLAFDQLNAHMHEVHDIQRDNLVRSQDRRMAYEKFICDLETRSLKPEVRSTILKKLQVRHTHQGHLNKIINDNLREFQLLELQHIKEKFELDMVSFDEVGNKKIVHENRLADMRLRHMNEIHEEKENVMIKKEAAKEVELQSKYDREIRKLQNEQKMERKQLRAKQLEKLGAKAGNNVGSKAGSAPGSKGGSKIGSRIGSKAGSIQGSRLGSVGNSAPLSRDDFTTHDVVTDATTNKATLQQGLMALLSEVADEPDTEEVDIENGSKYPRSVQLLMSKHRREIAELEKEIKNELNDCFLSYEVKLSDLEAAQQSACELLLAQQNSLVEEMRESQEKEIKMEETMHDNEMKMLVERRMLTSVLSSVSDGIINITPKGIVTRFNKAAEVIFQWKASEILGQNVSLLMEDATASKHDEYINTYLNTGIAKVVNSGRRVQGKRKDGSVFTMHLSLSELKEGETHLFTGIVHDLTEELAEEERQKAIETAKNAELEAFAKKLDVESKKCDDLLRQILPASVSEALMNGQQVEPQHFAAASVFYFDLVGFTTISAQVSPLEIVGLLNDLYEQFDNVIANYDAYKVETIGDSYMIASGVPNVIENHACELAKMALHLLEVAKRWVYKPNPNIKIRLRMGINSGPVIAGVVGTKMPRYCLFGETSMRIHVSASTHALLSKDETFRMTRRDEVELKVWVQLARFALDQVHVDLVGRQTQLHVHPQTHMDGLVRQLIHDDAFRDETANLGTAKIRVFTRLVLDNGRHAPIEELEPYNLVDGMGQNGTMPLIVVAPPRNNLSFGEEMESLAYSQNAQYTMLGLAMPPYEEFGDSDSKPRRKKLGANSPNSKSIEEKRKADRIRQRKCRARKKEFRRCDTHSWACGCDARLGFTNAGLDDLRQWTMAPGNKPGLQATVNIYLDEATMKVVSGAFPYMVDTAKATGSGEVASLQFHLISQTEPFEIDGIKIQPFKVEHGKVKGGEPYYALGFRINDFSYVSDTNKIPPEGIEIIKGSNTIIMDALRPTEHSSHFSFKQAFDTLESLLPDSGKGYFVGLTHDVEHEDILQWIKDQKGTKNITCAYDGLMIDME